MVNNVWVPHAEIASRLIGEIESKAQSASERRRTRGDELSEQEFRALGLTTIKQLASKSNKLSDRAFAKASGYHRETIKKYREKYPQVRNVLHQEFLRIKS